MDYWKQLLIKQQERGKRGFTIPFIIGSQDYLSGSSNVQNIRDLIIDMVKNDSFETCIRYCLDTNELICEIRNPDNSVSYPTYNGKYQKSLSIASLNNNLGISVEEVIANLMDKFQDKIDNGKYSAKRNYESRETIWEGFGKPDEDFIINCFKEL